MPNRVNVIAELGLQEIRDATTMTLKSQGNSASRRLALAASERHEPRLHRVQYDQFDYRTVLRIANVDVPVLRNLTHYWLFTQADFQNVILWVIGRSHTPGSQVKWCMTVLTTKAVSRTTATHNKLSSRSANRFAIHTRVSSRYRTSPVSIISSNSAPLCPAPIAATNASTHACCPLSCRHRRMEENPGQPQPLNLRKLSSCRIRPPQNASNRSLGNALWPLAK